MNHAFVSSMLPKQCEMFSRVLIARIFFPSSLLSPPYVLEGVQYWHRLVSMVSLVASSSIDPHILMNFYSLLNNVCSMDSSRETLIAVVKIFSTGSQQHLTILLHVIYSAVKGT